MNERHDDLASAWLDGELTDAERRELDTAGVPGDEVRRARDELEAVRDALAAPVDVPEGLADAHIARALQAAAVPEEALGARVVGLRSGRRARADRLLARAAAVVLVLGGLGVAAAAVIGDGDAGRDDTALTAGDAGPAADGEGGDAREGSATLGIAPSQEHADAEVADGPLSSTATELVAADGLAAPALLAALEALFGPAATWPAEPLPPDTCSPGRSGTGASGVPVAVVAFQRDGVPLELVVPADTEPYLLERGTCRRVR